MRLIGRWSSVRSSQVGLTASGSGKEIGRGVDEPNKLSREGQAGCLSAVEEGLVPINGGKHHEILEAEVVVIAKANVPSRLAPELMDRFDFILDTPEPNVQESRQIIEARIRSWGYSRRSNIGDLGRFLTWIRSLAHARLHHMDVTFEDVEAAARFVVELNQRP